MRAKRMPCPGCGKRIIPLFDPKELRFDCPKCKSELPLTRGSRRRINLFRAVYHLMAFGLILLTFTLLKGIWSVVFAAVAIPLAGLLEHPLVTRIFFETGRYKFEAPALAVQKDGV